jgi:hypothetical protein
MKAFRALGAPLCAGLICALGAGRAGAQSPLVLLGNATSPGGAHVDVGAFSIIGRDSGTGAPCIVSSSPTCSFGGSVTATIAPFTVVGTSTPITTGASSANTPITATSTLIVLTAGANDLYYKLGTSNAVTAASTDNYLGAGRSISIAVGSNTYIAAISPAGASTLYVVGGTGGSPSLSGGGGVVSGGGASYTAAAAPYSVSAGANKPAGISTTNSAQWLVPVKPGTTTEIDLSLPSGILGADGATIMSSSNPLNVLLNAGTAVIGHVITDSGSIANTTLQTQTDTVMVGGVNVKEINGVAPSMGNGVSGTGVQRVTLSSDSTGQVALASGATVAATQATASNLNAQVVGNVADGAADSGNPDKVGGVYNSSATTYTSGNRANLPISQHGNVRSLDTVYGCSGCGDGLASVTGLFAVEDTYGSSATASPAVTPWLYNGTTLNREKDIVGAINSTGAGTESTAPTPTAAATQGIAPVVSTALESCHVLKASPGNLYTLAVTIQATSGVLQVFNATSAPSDGAVTPIWWIPVVSNGTFGGGSWAWDFPLRGSTGLVACFSSATTPFTKTASATAAITAGVE